MSTHTTSRRKQAMFGLAALLIAGMVGTAQADEISNDLDLSVDATVETLSLTAGGAPGTVNLRVIATGTGSDPADGKSGCNFSGGGSPILTADVVSSAPARAIVLPASVTFDSCGDVIPLSVVPLSAGATTISLSLVVETAPGTFDLAPATFTVNVTSADTVKPTITADTRGYTPGTWTNEDVQVSFTCADNTGGSGIATDTVAGTTLTDSGENQSVTNAGTCVDNAGNVADPATVNNIDIDKGPPTITADYNGYTPGTWTNQNVEVDFTCADGLSGIATDEVVDDNTVSTEGENQSVASVGACIDNAGNGATGITAGNIDIDKTKPVISADTNGYTPGTWTNQNVVVDFTCADAGTPQSGTGIDTVAGATVSTNGADQSVTNTGVCIDNAGNVADPATVNNIDIDKGPPTITADYNGYTPGTWTNQNVEVDFTCADGLSGIATDEVVDDNTVSTEGENQSVASVGACIDNAGNGATGITAGNIDIDKTKPVISADTNGYTPGTWTNQNVVVDFTCADAGTPQSGTGIDTVAGATVSTNGADQSVTNTGVCIDNAGNEADTATVNNIDVDKAKPVASVTGVVHGATYFFGTTIPTAGCTTEDQVGLSGVATFATLSSVGGPLGAVTKTCSGATDNAGNAGDAAVATYTVSYERDGGIRQPINPDNTSVFQRGKAVPVKFGLKNDTWTGFDTSTWTIKKVKVTCAVASATELEVVDATAVNGFGNFRYDSVADQYIYNADFRNDTVGTCWKIRVDLNDGSAPLESAVFKLQK